MTDLRKPEIKPESHVDRELARLDREVERTRGEYQAATDGDEREQCWKLYQRAMTNLNNAIAKANPMARHG